MNRSVFKIVKCLLPQITIFIEIQCKCIFCSNLVGNLFLVDFIFLDLLSIYTNANKVQPYLTVTNTKIDNNC